MKFKKTTISSPKYPVADNLLNQEFKVRNQNQVWVSDITYIQTKKGCVYLTAEIDLFDRKVIGWSISKTMKAIDTTIAAFKQALQPSVNSKPKINISFRPRNPICMHSLCAHFIAK